MSSGVKPAVSARDPARSGCILLGILHDQAASAHISRDQEQQAAGSTTRKNGKSDTRVSLFYS